jgi:hypothetical protein
MDFHQHFLAETTPQNRRAKMAFPAPTFPLLSNIWQLADNEPSNWPQPRPADLKDVPTQIAQPLSMIPFDPFEVIVNAPLYPIIIRFPKGTAVRDGLWNTSGAPRGFGDLVECPPGSGNVYGVTHKLTVGRGYVNEHVRCVAIRLLPGTRTE